MNILKKLFRSKKPAEYHAIVSRLNRPKPADQDKEDIMRRRGERESDRHAKQTALRTGLAEQP